MKRLFIILLLIALAASAQAAFDPATGTIVNEKWRSGVPLGGIGCGKLEICPDGSFGYYTGNNNWDRPTGRLKSAFMAVYGEAGQKKAARMLRLKGSDEYDGVENIEKIEYTGWYPTAELRFSDSKLPVRVELLAWSPLIPHNTDDSSLPAAVLRFKVSNPTNYAGRAVVLVCWPHLVGWGGDKETQYNDLTANTFDISKSATAPGIVYTISEEAKSKVPANVNGQYFLGTFLDRLFSLSGPNPYDASKSELPFWSKFSKEGDFDREAPAANPAEPAIGLSVEVKLEPHESRNIEFILCWYFPDHITSQKIPGTAGSTETRTENVGHCYAARFESPTQIAEYVAANRNRLLDETREWQNRIKESNLPPWLKLKLVNCAFPAYASTVLTRDGRFVIQESPVDMKGATGTMDQRMAAHGFWTQLFPELDQNELRIFAQCQDKVLPNADGRIPHFNGNIHNSIGDPNVDYGITDWPDLSSSFVMQTLKYYRWTGDEKFMADMWPHVQRALDWLAAADQDGDGIPEGGSTYDYESLPRGAFIYNASCVLGALRSGVDIARIMKDENAAKAYEDRFAKLRESVMKRLWNGSYFIKHLDPKTGNKAANSFIAQLAGDWLSRLALSGPTLAPDVTDSTISEIIKRHVKPFSPVPPMEVTPDGLPATSACYMLQHEPYVGCEAMYLGYTDDGLDVIKRVFDAAWTLNRNPWHQSLVYEAPAGKQGWLASYMTCPTTYHVLNALSGANIDAHTGTMYIDPKVNAQMPEMHMPVFFSKFWLWMDYVPAQNTLKLRVIKSFGDPLVFTRVASDAGCMAITLPRPFTAKEGEALDLSLYITSLVTYPQSRQIAGYVKAQSPARPGIPAEGWVGSSGAAGEEDYEGGTIQGAVDGFDTTRWSSGAPMRPGDWLRLDMGRDNSISRIVLDTAKSKNDYPRGVTVMVSSGGIEFSKIAELSREECISQQKDGVLEISFSPVKARYIKIIQHGSEERWYWSIHELYVY